MRLETLAIHAGGEADPGTGAVSPPIHLATTFKHGPAGERIAGYEYQREGDPTNDRLRQAVAALEGGAAALTFASGMAAIGALLESLPNGARIAIPDDCYTGLRVLAAEFLPERGIVVATVDMADLEAVRKACADGIDLVWAETPSNPRMKVCDIAALATIAHEAGGMLVCDNTFASPVLQRPLALGADAVMHSTTKYFGGHSDVLGGALAFARNDALFERVAHRLHIAGANMSPFSAWLTLRGCRSLPARMALHCANARRVAEFLAGRDEIERVNYPGLASHPGHAIAAKQMRDFGGMLSIEVRGGREAALAMAGRLKIFTNATSLGGCESLIEHRASVEGDKPVSPQNLLRVSVGLEHADDLIADLEQALQG
ncbi:aminotransferase class I/II-fold pyridoxal phosphate-dependent enzyme [Luteimonas sp. SX5]|uniref:Aminotransferase class I/II-fold pyridoxal phosphate-dependent enzyme n=1 Tax=Luteimonas galliterrae TaxID=2940486 RepID=A0ABT0MKQ6_9GAMM|nr:aminotransferase class I/II-fold pyridoxal phosphate-dependent enzyme [Luteimonas galliterrae]MCL1635466.1 aminotransferase class I/II-fold pyridoxal phosphate-dependent enzyme [Luteimonas galliterrae]